VNDWSRRRKGLRESKRNSIDSPKQCPDLKEKDIERLILDWLNAQPGCKAWKNKSMGTFDPIRGIYRANHSKYSEKGSSDILGIWNGKMLCIEVKSRRGTLRPEQKVFLDSMGTLGALTLVARSLHDVVERFSVEQNTLRKDCLHVHDEPLCHSACTESYDKPGIAHGDSG